MLSKTEIKLQLVRNPTGTCPACSALYCEHIDAQCPLAPYMTDKQRLDWLETILRTLSSVQLDAEIHEPGQLVHLTTRESVGKGVGSSLRAAIDRAAADSVKILNVDGQE